MTIIASRLGCAKEGASGVSDSVKSRFVGNLQKDALTPCEAQWTRRIRDIARLFRSARCRQHKRNFGGRSGLCGVNIAKKMPRRGSRRGKEAAFSRGTDAVNVGAETRQQTARQPYRSSRQTFGSSAARRRHFKDFRAHFCFREKALSAVNTARSLAPRRNARQCAAVI